MLRKTLTYAALAAVLSVGSATSQVLKIHEVTIFDNDLMPPIVFAEPGDWVRFVNNDEAAHVVWSQNESWSTGEIPPNVAVQFMVQEWMDLSYKLDSAYFQDYSQGTGSDPYDGTVEEGIDIADTNGNGEGDEGAVLFEPPAN